MVSREKPPNLPQEEWLFAQQVSALRAEHGWLQEELAARVRELGVTHMQPVTISKIEAGGRRVRLAEVPAFTTVFGTTLAAMLNPASAETHLRGRVEELRAERQTVGHYRAVLPSVAAARERARATLVDLDEMYGDGTDLGADAQEMLEVLRAGFTEVAELDMVGESQRAIATAEEES